MKPAENTRAPSRRRVQRKRPDCIEVRPDKTLYVDMSAGVIDYACDSLTLRSATGEARQFPLPRVRAVVAVGDVQLSPAALRALMGRKIGVTFFAGDGRYQGVLLNSPSDKGGLRLAQYRAVEDKGLRSSLAARIVLGKLYSCHNVIQRIQRRDGIETGAELREIERAIQTIQARQEPDNDWLMGCEGTASAAYFRAFGRGLPAELGFTTRARRPPPDPVNALLSFGYALLLKATLEPIHIRGLDPCLGFLHREYRDRPSLACDLMEEFRPLVVDRTVRAIILRKQVRPKDFECTVPAGARLRSNAIAAIVAGFEEALSRTVTPRDGTGLRSYRELLQLQTDDIAASVRDGKLLYQPLNLR